MEFALSKKNVPWTLTGINFPLSFSNNIKLSDYIIDNYFSDKLAWKYNQNVKIIDEKNIEITIIDFPDGLENANYLKLEWSPITDKSYSFWVIDKVKIRYVKDKEKGLIKNIKLYCFLDIYVNYHDKMISSFKGVITTNRYHPKELNKFTYNKEKQLNAYDVGNYVCDDFCKNFKTKMNSMHSDHPLFSGEDLAFEEIQGALNFDYLTDYKEGHLIFLARNKDRLGTNIYNEENNSYNLPYRLLFIPNKVPVIKNKLEESGSGSHIENLMENGDKYLAQIINMYTAPNLEEQGAIFAKQQYQNTSDLKTGLNYFFQQWGSQINYIKNIPQSWYDNNAFGRSFSLLDSKIKWKLENLRALQGMVYDERDTSDFDAGCNVGGGYTLIFDKYVSIRFPREYSWEYDFSKLGLNISNAYWHFIDRNTFIGYFDSQITPLTAISYNEKDNVELYPNQFELDKFNIRKFFGGFEIEYGIYYSTNKMIKEKKYFTPHIFSNNHTQMEFKSLKSNAVNIEILNLWRNKENSFGFDGKFKIRVGKSDIISPIYIGEDIFFTDPTISIPEGYEETIQISNKLYNLDNKSLNIWPVNNDSGNEFLRSHINSITTAKDNARNQYNVNKDNTIINTIGGIVGGSAGYGYGLGMRSTAGDLTAINAGTNLVKGVANLVSGIREARMIYENEISSSNAIIIDARNRDANIQINNSDNSFEYKIYNETFKSQNWVKYYLYCNVDDELNAITQYRKINGVKYKKVFKIDNITDLLNHENVESFEFSESEQIASRMFCPKEIKDYFAEILKYIKFWNIDLNKPDDLFSQDIENIMLEEKI